jgi:hypothetical protein
MDNSDGFWTAYKGWAIKGFVLLGMFAIFLWGAVLVTSIIGLS